MSADRFIIALGRFISQRGLIDIIRSVNNTNFVGPEKELRNALKELDQTLCSSELNWYGIEQKFNQSFTIKELDQTLISSKVNNYRSEQKLNATSSPQMGGVSESLVKSVKCALKFTKRTLSLEIQFLQMNHFTRSYVRLSQL